MVEAVQCKNACYRGDYFEWRYLALFHKTMDLTEFEKEFRRLVFFTGATVGGYSAVELAAARTVLPYALRFIYESAGRARLYRQHNQLLPPEALEADEGHFVSFAQENQGVVWGFKAAKDEADPTVFQRQLDEEDGRYGEWISETMLLSDFLISFGYWNAANGATAKSIVGEAGESTFAKMEQLPIVWKCPHFEVRRSEGLCIATESGDFHAFGSDTDDIKSVAQKMDLVWFDVEG